LNVRQTAVKGCESFRIEEFVVGVYASTQILDELPHLSQVVFRQFIHELVHFFLDAHVLLPTTAQQLLVKNRITECGPLYSAP
jgi:hypothetical protein